MEHTPKPGEGEQIEIDFGKSVEGEVSTTTDQNKAIEKPQEKAAEENDEMSNEKTSAGVLPRQTPSRLNITEAELAELEEKAPDDRLYGRR